MAALLVAIITLPQIPAASATGDNDSYRAG
jgi:hypothetical protein